jgi:polyhydroxyalkanoate synthesis regulator phasin
MAGRGIVIDFLANVRDYLKGAGDVEESFDRVAGALDDVARDGEQATERLEGSFEDLSRTIKQETEQATEHAEDSFRDLSRTASRETGQIGDDLETSMRSGARSARESLKDVRSEAGQTARESAASFDGSAESIVGSFQEIAANAGAAFGPAGFIAGVIAAGVIGTITSQVNEAGEAAEATREQVKGLVDELFEAHGDPALIDYVQQLRDFLEKDYRNAGFFGFIDDMLDGNVTNFDAAKRESEEYGLAIEDLLRAYSGGDAQTARRVIADLAEQQEKANRAAQDADSVSVRRGYELDAEAIGNLIGKIESQNEVLGVAKEQYDAVKAAADGMAAAQALASSETEILNTAFDEAAEATEDFISKETGLFDVGAYLTAMQTREQAIRDYVSTVQTSGLTPEAITFLNGQGIEAASAMLAGYKSASPEQQKELNRVWTEAAKDNSGTYITELGAGISGSTVPPPTVGLDPRGDGAAYVLGLQQYLNQNPVRANVQMPASYGRVIP